MSVVSMSVVYVVYHDCDDDEECRDEGAELSPTPTLHHQRRTSKAHYHSITSHILRIANRDHSASER
jgi:hypothetical protein